MKNLPAVPVLAEPPPVCTSANAVSETGPNNEAMENGEARESNETGVIQRKLDKSPDSRGGGLQFLLKKERGSG